MTKPKQPTSARSAKSGKYVSKATAKRRPATTVTETRKAKPAGQLAREQFIFAAECMDWQQVVLNGGPPCFHLSRDGFFCGRAGRWDGHDEVHEYVSLADLLRKF